IELVLCTPPPIPTPARRSDVFLCLAVRCAPQHQRTDTRMPAHSLNLEPEGTAMNGPLIPARESILAAKLREACADSKLQAALCEATGWDSSMPNKVKNNQAGITVEKISQVFRALGLVVTTTEYMDYLARGNLIGSNCECARMNMGECGRGC